MLGKKGWAALSAKSADAQQLLFVMVGVAQELSDGSDRCNHSILALHFLASMYRIFKGGDMFLTEEQSSEALEHVQSFFEHYSWLLQDAVASGDMFFPVVSKLHSLYHVAEFSRYMNPMSIWAYVGGDFMGTMVMSRKACVTSSPMHLIGNKMMVNFRLALNILLENRST